MWRWTIQCFIQETSAGINREVSSVSPPSSSPCNVFTSLCNVYQSEFPSLFFVERLCEEDYIELQEIIVPVVVGAVLALLLVCILIAYLVAYIRRKRKESSSQYEPVDD